MRNTTPTVVSVSSCPLHAFSKITVSHLTLLAGQGVEGDAHCGATVKHRSRVNQDPTQPNLRQVRLIHSELFAELANKGFNVTPGALGENILTCGISLLELPTGTLLQFGDTAVLKLTGLRNPCAQIDNYKTGLLSAVLRRSSNGILVRRAGVMAIVMTTGKVSIGDSITVTLPDEPHTKLERV